MFNVQKCSILSDGLAWRTGGMPMSAWIHVTLLLSYKFQQHVFSGHAVITYPKHRGEEEITEFCFLGYRVEQNWTHRTINLLCIRLVFEKMIARHK
jgi:hypothetical protein